MSVAFDTAGDVTLTVEAAFGDDPLDTTPTWTDITTAAKTINIDRGRTHFNDRIARGKATIMLDNNNGDFDPSYAAGSYFPDVRPMVPIRVSVDYPITGSFKLNTSGRGLDSKAAVGDAPIFTGFATAWPQRWTSGRNATVPLEAVDGFKVWNLLPNIVTVGPGTPRQQILDLLVAGGWPSDWIDLYSGTHGNEVNVQSPGGSLLGMLQDVEDAEGGLLFIQANGHAMLQHRDYRASLSSVATFSDDGVNFPYSAVDTTIGFDDFQIWNTVRFTRRGGTVSTVTDATSKTAYIERVLTVADNVTRTDAGGATLAAALLARYKDPHERIGHIEIQPHMQPDDLWPLIATLDLSEKITVKRTPPAGNTKTIDGYIEGIEHRIDAGTREWITTWRLSQYA